MDNRYGVDVKYFQKTVEREMAGIKNQTPEDLARVFARLSRTSDRSVLLEPEFAKKHIDRIEELEQENELLKIKSMNLADAVENNDDLAPIKYALRCRRLVNEVRSLCGKTLTPALHKEGES